MKPTMGGSLAGLSGGLLRGGPWAAEEVARLLDVDLDVVRLWLRCGSLLHVVRSGVPMVSARGLFLFLSGRVEVMLSPETVAESLEVTPGTVRQWLRDRRLPSVKLGAGRKAPRRVPASAVRQWLSRLGGKEVAA